MEFIPNKYDSCVVNKTVGGKQLTVVWHVDDLKVSHCQMLVVEDLFLQMDAKYGQETPLTVSHGLVQNYLGMTLNFLEPHHAIIQISNYVKTMLCYAPSDMDGTANQDHVNLRPLPHEKKTTLVHLVMQGLYLSQHR